MKVRREGGRGGEGRGKREQGGRDGEIEEKQGKVRRRGGKGGIARSHCRSG